MLKAPYVGADAVVDAGVEYPIESASSLTISLYLLGLYLGSYSILCMVSSILTYFSNLNTLN